MSDNPSPAYSVEAIERGSPYQANHRCHLLLNHQLRCSRCGEAFSAPSGGRGNLWWEAIVRAFQAEHADCPPPKTWLEKLADTLAACLTEEDLIAAMDRLPARVSTHEEDEAKRELYFQNLQRRRNRAEPQG